MRHFLLQNLPLTTLTLSTSYYLVTINPQTKREGTLPEVGFHTLMKRRFSEQGPVVGFPSLPISSHRTPALTAKVPQDTQASQFMP